jgi:hypothetical protein
MKSAPIAAIDDATTPIMSRSFASWSIVVVVVAAVLVVPSPACCPAGAAGEPPDRQLYTAVKVCAPVAVNVLRSVLLPVSCQWLNVQLPKLLTKTW